LPRPAYQIPKAIRTTKVSKKNLQELQYEDFICRKKKKKGKLNNYFSSLSTPTIKSSPSKPSGNYMYKVALMLE